MKLTAKKLRGLTAPGKYSDGDGLLLHVVSAERRNWVFRYQHHGKDRAMGLGSAAVVSLDTARQKALQARQLLAEGIDPLDAKHAAQAAAQAQAAARVTFAQAASNYIAAHEAGWKHPAHVRQWRNTLASYAEPVIGVMPVDAIDIDAVLKVLEPIWRTKPETASRVRSRIELVLDYAAARGWRARGNNPATWRGNLKLMLPATAKLHRPEHYAAMDWRTMPVFMTRLRESTMMGAPCLAFAVVTAARPMEARAARWSEIDLDRAVWTLPPARMKTGREHRVPLSGAALAILTEQLALHDGSGLVFRGQRFGNPVSDMTLAAVLHKLECPVTTHGFRSTFRDWAAETTAHPNHVVELALAHAIGSAVEAAYRRGDLLEKRAVLMADWANYLSKPEADVVALRAA